MSVLGALQLVLLAALGFAVASGILVTMATPLAIRLTAQAAPESRHRWLLLVALSPVLLPAAGVLATLTPSLLGLIWPDFDHCLGHGGHAHLCFVHLPAHLGNEVSWAVLFCSVVLLGARVVRGIIGLRRGSSWTSSLLSRAVANPALSARVLPIDAPLCLSVGVLRPATVVSRGFVASVNADDLAAVLVHERTHAKRKDTLVRLFARAATPFMLPWVRARLLAEIELAAERSCDEAAARSIGDRLTMAEVILKVERLVSAMPHPLRTVTASFGGTAVPARVAALLEPPRPDVKGAALPVCVGAVLVALFAASEPLHHVTETILGTLTHW
jgi:Zn-dependent protease with chaperone function